MKSLFLHRISLLCVYLSIAATTQDAAGQDPHQLEGRGVRRMNRKGVSVNGDETRFDFGWWAHCGIYR